MRKWSSEDLKSLANRYQEMLRLTTFPVAVRLFSDPQELEEAKDERGRPVRKLAGKRLALCQFLSQARYLGRTMIGTAESLSMCTLGAAAVGFKDLPPEYADGYVRAYFTTEEVARRAVATIPRLETGKYMAMLVSPLDRMPLDPDVVVFYGNTAQIHRFVHAYLYDKGERLEFSSSGEAVCADLLVASLKTGKPSIGFPCNGGRILSWPSDEELGCGVPGTILEEVLEGLEFTHRGGVRYPITWQHIDWEPPPGTVIRNIMEGKGFYPPEERHPERKKA